MCNCNYSMDLKTPRNVSLTAFYKRSFAFHTVKDRMPIILTKVIDGLVRSKDEIKKEFGEQSQDELKLVIGDLSKLKYEILTNKPLDHLTSTAPDIRFYNDYIDQQAGDYGPPTYFSTIWLLSECYMYRRIREIFEFTRTLNQFDPFRKQKQESFLQTIPIIGPLSQYVLDILVNNKNTADKAIFLNLLKINLWGNKCDLSLSDGVIDTTEDYKLFDVSKLEKYILCDHSALIWEAIIKPKTNSKIIDYVLDNAGYELFTDLCLADYLITTNSAETVRFHVKGIPWFISDVMTADFHWILKHLKNNTNNIDEASLSTLSDRWIKYVESGRWVLIENQFWTLPVDYSYMQKLAPALYEQLGEAKLVIFKGDMNYRKLFGEKNWDPTTPIEVALQGFRPATLCSLRTIKADIVCGLDKGVAERAEALNEKWMETGDYGLIQFSDKFINDCKC